MTHAVPGLHDATGDTSFYWPAGRYTLELNGYEEKETSNGESYSFNFKCMIMDHELDQRLNAEDEEIDLTGKNMEVYVFLPKDQEKKGYQRRTNELKAVLNAFLIEVNEDNKFDGEDGIGNTASVNVRINKYKDKNGNDQTNNNYRNWTSAEEVEDEDE